MYNKCKINSSAVTIQVTFAIILYVRYTKVPGWINMLNKKPS